CNCNRHWLAKNWFHFGVYSRFVKNHDIPDSTRLLIHLSAPAVAGFMTGSAFTIATGQIPGLLGIGKRLNTRESAYKVVINTLKNLKFTTIDAAFGLPCLFALYFVRWFCGWGAKRWPKYRKPLFFLSVMRNGLVVIFITLAAFLYTRNDPKGKSKIKILQDVPRGFKDLGPVEINADLIGHMAPQLPVATIILLLEHIAIAKSFGRLNDYKIIPDQEVIAI